MENYSLLCVHNDAFVQFSSMYVTLSLWKSKYQNKLNMETDFSINVWQLH